MTVIDYFKSMIRDLIEKKKIEKENIFQKERIKLIKLLDHTWTKEEYDRYNSNFENESNANTGPYTAAEHQGRRLWEIKANNKGYLTEDEIYQFEKDIQIRLLEEKKEVLISKRIKNQLTQDTQQAQVLLIEDQIKELKKVV